MTEPVKPVVEGDLPETPDLDVEFEDDDDDEDYEEDDDTGDDVVEDTTS